MTKIAIESASIAAPDLFVKALIVLPETAVIAFQTHRGLLYIRDGEETATLRHLAQAGIAAKVVYGHPDR